MEERKQGEQEDFQRENQQDFHHENLEWLMARNPSLQYSPNHFRTLPVPEIPRRNHVNRLSSLPATLPVPENPRSLSHPPHPGMIVNRFSSQSSPNPYNRTLPVPEDRRTFSHPSPPGNFFNRLSSLQASRTLQLPAVHNTNNIMNPNYADSFHDYHDYLLRADFDRLNLSSTPHQSAAHIPNGGKIGSIPSGNNSYSDQGSFGSAQFSNSYPADAYDLQRMRIESAVRGQLGMFVQPQYPPAAVDDQILNGFLHNLNLNNAIHGQELNNLHRQGFVLDNRINHPELGYVFQDNSGRNKTNNFQRREPSRGRYDYENHRFSTLSYHGRHRQRGQNLLEELRSKIFSSFEELRGKIFLLAKDQNGARDLQKILGEGTPQEKQIIFSELKDHLPDLMVDPFANYLAQKMFEVGSVAQITELLLLIINDKRSLLTICVDMHGTRAMQKLLGHLTTQEQRCLVISALRGITVTLTKSSNGHHVVEHCLKNFPREDTLHLLDIVADNCLDIAMDKSGCCVIQQCVEYARGGSRDRLVAEITANALVLSENSYGNYVVQYIIGLGNPHVTRAVIAQLAGNFVSLSKDKYGSNVVEKCMEESSDELVMIIAKEITRNSEDCLTVIQDPFGNYVAQRLMEKAKGSALKAMLAIVQRNNSSLQSHPHGKRVSGKTNSCGNNV